MNARPVVRALSAVGVFTTLAVGASAVSSYFFSQARAETAPVPVTQSAPLVSGLPDFTALVDRYGPAVVNISVSGSLKVSQDEPQFPQLNPNDPFSQFFKNLPMPKAPPNGVVRGVGSGFIVSADGIILTNTHVVDDAKEVTVRLTDNREFRAKVIGKDPVSDVAVLRIEAKNLPTVKLGDSGRVKVGEWVVAIGSPYGFDNSVTAGIVSAKARSLGGDSYVPFLQTDAAVNPGNSGGPLFNLKGEVIGINSQIYSRNGGFQGLSFAIPINVAYRVENEIIQTGHVTRGRLGVTIQGVTQSLAESFGLSRPEGALVSFVDPDSPASKAGLEVGDVITKVNGEPIVHSNDLPVRVAEMKPGAQLTMEVWRNGGTRQLTATIGSFKSEKVAAADSAPASQGRLGLAVHPLSPEQREQAGVAAGLLVDASSGPAADAGIEPGDIVLAVNNTPVASAQQLRSLTEKAGKHVALLVQHGEAKVFVPIELG
ncbi:MAG TPA: DegQ family serine endoprotease [Usitatibacter sp.]|nr:DegQ family serine endoprotease [Usitatibacter sp.]